MIIYNVTVKIDNDIREEWCDWMIKTHIMEVMNTGLFLEYKISKILLELEDKEGTNYSIQYLCKNMETLKIYQKKHAKKLQQEHSKKFKNKFVAFRTLLEVVDNKSYK